jgi:hypothetical protein
MAHATSVIQGERGKIMSLARPIFVLASLAFLFGIVAEANAGAIATRGALITALGGPGTLENFESFSVGNGAATALGSATLNSTSIVGGQGPGLVQSGLNFTFGTGGLQWDGAGYFGSPSKEILSGSPAGQPLGIQFTGLVNAFGIDLRAFTGFGATATVNIFAPNDTTLIASVSGIALSSSGVPVFFGWQDAGGIGEVTLTQTGQPWSPIIDNLEYGNAATSSVPEPFTLSIFGSGLAGALAMSRRKKRTA